MRSAKRLVLLASLVLVASFARGQANPPPNCPDCERARELQRRYDSAKEEAQPIYDEDAKAQAALRDAEFRRDLARLAVETGRSLWNSSAKWHHDNPEDPSAAEQEKKDLERYQKAQKERAEAEEAYARARSRAADARKKSEETSNRLQAMSERVEEAWRHCRSCAGPGAGPPKNLPPPDAGFEGVRLLPIDSSPPPAGPKVKPAPGAPQAATANKQLSDLDQIARDRRRQAKHFQLIADRARAAGDPQTADFNQKIADGFTKEAEAAEKQAAQMRAEMNAPKNAKPGAPGSEPPPPSQVVPAPPVPPAAPVAPIAAAPPPAPTATHHCSGTVCNCGSQGPAPECAHGCNPCNPPH